MKCFYYFKEKTKSRAQKSAPTILKKHSKSADPTSQPPQERAVRSSGAAATSSRSIPEIYEERAHNLRIFTFAELSRATNNFSRLFKIGEGGFGSVYRGTVNPSPGDGDAEHIAVAIKKLDPNGHQGHKQWVAEVQFLGVVDHPNLVKLIGYCAGDGDRGIQRLLVYEYMPNRSLEDHLFGRAFPALPWARRLRILLGAARGLAYLHEELEIQVIYRDFKASNVLLDGDFEPKLSDFGLAREGPADDRTHVSTAVVGTYGYAAPDYVETGHLTAKSDVWSFGVVLYEMLTGRRSMERGRPRSEQKLLDWVKKYPPEGRKFSAIIDPRLEGRYTLGAARKVAKLADVCLAKGSKDRPKMSGVVERLNKIIEETEESPPGEYPPRDDGDCEGEEEDAEGRENSVGPTESAKRRMAHLAKIGENLSGVGRRRFASAQRAKVV